MSIKNTSDLATSISKFLESKNPETQEIIRRIQICLRKAFDQDIDYEDPVPDEAIELYSRICALEAHTLH